MWTNAFFIFTSPIHCVKMSVFGVILVHIFPHSDWIRRDTEYPSVFSPNAENGDQNNSVDRHFSRSDSYKFINQVFCSYDCPRDAFSNGQRPLTNFLKGSILDVWLGFEYAAAFSYTILFKTLGWLPLLLFYKIV